MSNSKIGTLATLGAAAALTLGFGTSLAGTARPQPVSGAALGLEQVESIPMLTGPYTWQAIDDDTVIVWATRHTPYLVELAFESHDLKFSEVIGISQFGSRIYAKFDAVTVRGFRYPIDSIYRMTREEARNLARGT
jgi:Family of unknown function (DUF6491)